MSALPGLGVITLDTELRIRSWNDWLVAATGVPESAAVGRPVTELAPAGRAELLGGELTEVLQTGSSRVLAPALHRYFVLCAASIVNPYFHEMQQRVTIAPLRNETRVVGVIVTIEDVTARMVEEREHARGEIGGATATDTKERRQGVPVDAVGQTGAADWRLRAEATRSLKQNATPQEVAQLLEALQRDHDNFSVLSGALQVLVAIDHDVTQPLLELLEHPSANLRMHAALALGALGTQAGVPGLLRTLDDADTNVRFHAIEALGRLAAPTAVDALRQVAESGDFFLSFPAIDALARIDDAAVVPALVRLIAQEDVRPAVIDALAALGDEDCVGSLVQLINDGGADVGAVAAALTSIGRRYEETFGAAGFIVDAVRQAITPSGVERLSASVVSRAAPLASIVVILGWVGEAGLAALTAAIGDSEVRDTVSDALRAIGAPAVPGLVAQLRGGSREARVASAFLLGAIGDSQGAPALIEALTSHDNELLTTAARALAALGEVTAVDSLFALFAHPDVMVRQAAVSAVNSLGAAATETHVCGRLDDPDPRVRECAVRSGGYFAFDSCVAGIVRAVRDDVEEVRRAALEQLPLLEGANTLQPLLDALASETPRNRAAAAHSLRLMDDAAADGALIEALGDDDPWVRYFAAGSLAQRGTAGAVDTLEAMALIDAAPHARIAAIAALGALDADATMRVASIAGEDGDDEVASAALQALSGAAGPDAERLLERAIQSERGALRVAAAAALGGFHSSAAVHTLAWAARLAAPASLAATAMESLRRVASSPDADSAPAAVSALVELGLDASRREAVVQLLSALPQSAMAALAAHLAAPRPVARVLAVEALARMRNAGATVHVAGALDDPEPSVRSAAVAAFGRLGSSAVANRIVAMGEGDPDGAVRRRAVTVCRRYGWVPRDARTSGAR